MGDVVRARGIFVSGLAIVFRFATLFVVGDSKPPFDWWQKTVLTGCEWIYVAILIVGVFLAFIDDLTYGTYTHLVHVILMTIFLNAILIVMVNVSRGVFIGVLLAAVAVIALEMYLGSPIMGLIGIILSAFGVLTPIIIVLIAIGSILGLSMVF